MSKVLRIGGINIPAQKHVVVALATSIYGINVSRAKTICSSANVASATKVKDLSEENIEAIRHAIGKYKIEGELKREIIGNIRRLERIKSYRGIRHFRRLPVHGQRTRTNARTRKGARKAINK